MLILHNQGGGVHNLGKHANRILEQSLACYAHITVLSPSMTFFLKKKRFINWELGGYFDSVTLPL